FNGIIPYLVTPLSADGQVNEDALAKLCDDLIAGGVHGLTVLGSTGEFAYLEQTQRQRAVDVVVRAVAGRVPVLATVASTHIAGAIAQGLAYRQSGVDGMVAVLESYFPLADKD